MCERERDKTVRAKIKLQKAKEKHKYDLKVEKVFSKFKCCHLFRVSVEIKLSLKSNKFRFER